MYPHTVQVVRAPSISDGKGGSRYDWPNAVEHDERAFVQPRTTDEVTTGQTVLISRWWAAFPPNADVTSADRLDYNGVRYFVDGEVQACPAAWGPTDHLEANLRKVA